MDAITFSHNKTYLEALNTPARHLLERRPAITISSESGAGAATVAKLVLDDLSGQKGATPWAIFDRNLVEKVLEDHQLPERIKRFMPEDGGFHVQSAIEEMFGLHPSEWTLVQHTSETILRLANIGNVILVGRGAAIITSGLKNVLHVRLVGSMRDRVAYVIKEYNMKENEANDFISKTDKARKHYAHYYFKTSIEDPLHYHLIINTSRFDHPSAAKIVVNALLKMPLV